MPRLNRFFCSGNVVIGSAQNDNTASKSAYGVAILLKILIKNLILSKNLQI